ncbi:MAG TPA: signal peptidase II [Xanthomonadaceae bacterium]|nr:signal peptidase II [Xanthomonadaceae bacterium]
MTRPHPNALIWLWLSAVVIVADQITKHIALALLEPYQPVPVLPGFNWMLAFNEGAAFSFLADAGGWQRWFFTVMALAVSAVLAWWLSRTPRGHWQDALPFALIIGGALGNAIDRMIHARVVDFVQIYYDRWSWPAFNVADSAISVGAVLVLLLALRQSLHRRKKE